MNKKVLVLIEMFVALVAITVSLSYFKSCSIGPKKSGGGGECSSENETREGKCPAGETGRVFEVCKDNKFVESFNDCKKSGCSEVVFDRDIQPIITRNCVSCHPGFDGLDVAKAKIDDFLKRVNLPDDNPQRMPKAPNDPLKQADKDHLKAWKDGGLLPACADQTENTNPHLDLDYIESAIEDDLQSLSSGLQIDVRYLVTTHKSDEQANLSVLKQFQGAVNKASNSLSAARQIFPATAIDQYETVYRISLRDLKISAADWNEIEKADPINLESFTNRGLLIKQITRTKKPWLHVDSLAFASNEAQTYYKVRKIPATANELFTQLGVNFNGDLADFSALFVGLSTSRVAINKNRLVTRFDSNDGAIWITFDTNGLEGAKGNLFENPLLKSASGKVNYQFTAAEYIFSLSNGLHGYFISDNKGNRANAVPQNVASDYLTPFNPEIVPAISCYRCHATGILEAKDAILPHILENAAQFEIQDVEFVQQFYRDAGTAFTDANNDYAAALSRIGISVNDPDPVNVASDNLRRDMNAKQVASLFFLTEEEFKDGLSRSANARAQVGQLLTGGTITFQQLQASIAVIIKDLRIAQNPIVP